MHRPAKVALAALVGIVLWSLVSSRPVVAAPYIELTLVASPNPAAPDTPVTFKGTARAVGGTFANVVVDMEPGATSCEPAAICSVSPLGRPTWVFATLDGTPISYSAVANTYPGKVMSTYVVSCQPDNCLSTSASVTMKAPTLSVGISTSPSAPIMPGDTLHVVVSGSTNASPITGVDLQTTFVAGLDAPTNLPSGATWAGPPYSYIDDVVTLDPKVSYGFDAVVTAAIGGSVKLHVALVGAPYGLFAAKDLTLRVGPVPTATPRKTAAPTPRATQNPTALPATQTPAPVTPRPTASSAAPSLTPSSSGSSDPILAGGPGGLPSATGTSIPAAIVPTMATGGGPEAPAAISSPVTGVIAILVIGIVAAGFVVSRAAGHRRTPSGPR